MLNVSNSSSRLRNKIRRPKTLRGGSVSVLLFDFLGIWAIATIILRSAQDGVWLKSDKPVNLKNDIIVVVLVVIIAAHLAFGLIAHQDC